MTELDEVLTALQENNSTLAEIESELTDLRVEISNLPEKYIGREEAKKKASVVQKVAAVGASVFFLLGVLVFAFLLVVKSEREQACRENRIALRDAIILTDEAKQALQGYSPILTERLLSLEGTQPEKC